MGVDVTRVTSRDSAPVQHATSMGVGMKTDTCACGAARLHAKGKCKRCYHREYCNTDARKEKRRQYDIRNKERIRAHVREYNQTRRPPRNKSVSKYGVVRVPVKGWGCVVAGA
jgi:hypothetical protein